MEYDKKIKQQLLQKYFDGDSTLSDERLLKKVIDKPSSDDELVAQLLFTYAEQQRKERYSRPIKMRKTLSKRLLWIGVAAAMMLVSALVYNNSQFKNSDIVYCYINGDAISDYDEAAKYTEQTLDKVNEVMSAYFESLASLEQLIIK